MTDPLAQSPHKRLSYKEALEIVRKHAGKAQPAMVRFCMMRGELRDGAADDEARPNSTQVKISAVGQHENQNFVQLEARLLIRATSFGPDQLINEDEVVDIGTRMECVYEFPPDADMTAVEREVLARVSSVYHSWPYIREYVHSTLGRIQVPPVQIPVLSLNAAVSMAGFRPPKVAEKTTDASPPEKQSQSSGTSIASPPAPSPP